MCGIYGFKVSSSESYAISNLKTMSKSLLHRGPDQSGFYLDKNIALGIERLSILDIKNGMQPIYSNNRRYIIVHNGEIYNYKELRDELKNKGFNFETNTDTELIVNLYQYKGVDCLNDLNGMFAFAIYDLEKKELFIGRDRFGIKPIYYFFDNKQFIFASELKALILHPEIDKGISADSIDLFLTMEYIPSPLTIFEKINKLDQGHYLIFSNQSKLIKKKWYEFSYYPKIVLESENDYIERLDFLIAKSIKYRTLSDVPYGCFLSGGLDSSLISYYLSEISQNKIKTFNIAFEDSSFDESNFANFVSKHLETDHCSEMFSSDKMVEILPKIWKMMDEPFSDPSLLPTFLLTLLTSNQLKVALSGDGGDEVFAGYPTYLAHKLDSLIPKFSHNIIRLISNSIPIKHANMSLDFKLSQFSKGLGYTPELKHQYWLGSFNDIEKKSNYTSAFKELICNKNNLKFILDKYREESHHVEGWEKHLLQDFHFYLQDDMLVKVDRTSMANSLEVRVPFLDHRIVEFMAKVPTHLKYKRMTSKYILKKLSKKYLPNQIVNRKKKGFGIPIADWFCKSLKEPMCEIVQDKNSFINSIFKKKYTSALMSDHVQRKKNNQKLLWTLYVLENWYSNHKNATPLF